jgi:hypothetical protein
MLHRPRRACTPCRWNSPRYARIANTIVDWHIVMIEAQVNLAVATDAHADGVVLIQRLLNIVGDNELLPVTG